MKPISGFGSHDRDVVTLDGDVDITIASGQHPHTANILWREADVQGTQLLAYRPSHRHNLSRLQLGISTTPRGKTWRLVPQPAALIINSDGNVLVSSEAYRQYDMLMKKGDVVGAERLFKKELLPTKLELLRQEAIQALQAGGYDIAEATVQDTVAFMMNDPTESDRLMVQDRGPVILDQDLVELSSLKGVSSEALRSFVSIMKYRDQSEAAERLASNLEVEFPGIDIDAIEETLALRYVRDANLGGLVEEVPEPMRKTFWGLPKIVFEAQQKGKRFFNSLVERMALTTQGCYMLAVNEHGEGNDFLRDLGCQVAMSYDLCVMAIRKEEENFQELHEKWQLRADAMGSAINLGDLVGSIEEVGLDARPRPTISHDEPGGLADHATEMLERDLLRRVTPRDESVWLGDTEMFTESIPYVRHRRGDEQTLAGHPVAYLIEQAIQAMGQDANPAFMTFFDSEGNEHPLMESDIEVLRMKLHESYFFDEHGERMVRTITMPDGLTHQVQVVTIDGCLADVVEQLSPMVNGWADYRVMVHHELPSFGYVKCLDAGDRTIVGQAWVPPFIPARTLDQEPVYKAGDTLTFDTFFQYLVFVTQLTRVPTISLEQGMVGDKDAVPVISEMGEMLTMGYTYRPLTEVFPMVANFIYWVEEGVRRGRGLVLPGLDEGQACTDKHWGLPVTREGGEVFHTAGSFRDKELTGELDDVASWLEAITQELHSYQEWALEMVQKANAWRTEDFFNLLDQAYMEVAADPTVVDRRDIVGESGQRMSWYSALSMAAWQAVIGFSLDNAVLPSPVRKTRGAWNAEERRYENQWAENNSALWRIMGYNLNPDFYRGPQRLVQMVGERWMHHHPLENTLRTVYEGTSTKKVQKQLITYTDRGNFSTGIVGDALASWWGICIGMRLPAVQRNILGMTLPELIHAFRSETWSRHLPHQLYAAAQQYPRLKANRQFPNLERFLNLAFPESPQYESFCTPKAVEANGHPIRFFSEARTFEYLAMLSTVPELAFTVQQRLCSPESLNDTDRQFLLTLAEQKGKELGRDLVDLILSI